MAFITSRQSLQATRAYLCSMKGQNNKEGGSKAETFRCGFYEAMNSLKGVQTKDGRVYMSDVSSIQLLKALSDYQDYIDYRQQSIHTHEEASMEM